MAKAKTTTTGEFVNPYTEGITYPDFLAAVPSGASVRDYCGDNLTEEQLVWLELELEYFNNNKN